MTFNSHYFFVILIHYRFMKTNEIKLLDVIGVLLFRSWLPKIINIIRDIIKRTANIAKQIIDIRFECLSCQKIGNNKEHTKAK